MDEKTKEKSLELLKFIEYHYSHLTNDYLSKVKKDGFLEITFGDIKNLDFSVFGDIKNLYIISEVLCKEGLNISIEFDLVNYIPEAFIDKNHPSVDDVVLMSIQGNSIDEILLNVGSILNKIKNQKPRLNISYNINIGQFMFNNEETVELEGKQKDAFDCIFDKGLYDKVSWDEINEKWADTAVGSEEYNNLEIDVSKRSVRGAIKEINKKVEKYILPEKELIGSKDNEYWLQYQVDKGR